MFEYKGMPRGSKWHTILALKACKMLAKGVIEYLAIIVDTKKKVMRDLSDVHIVCKFLDVFMEDLPELPPYDEPQMY